MEFDPSMPIWLQLVREFTRRIVTGAWPSGEKIPGVRELALELRVNPNTVQRALAELDREGLSRSERTTGRFVTDEASVVASAREGLAAEAATAYVRSAQGLGMSPTAARELLGRIWAEIDERDTP